MVRDDSMAEPEVPAISGLTPSQTPRLTPSQTPRQTDGQSPPNRLASATQAANNFNANFGPNVGHR